MDTRADTTNPGDDPRSPSGCGDEFPLSRIDVGQSDKMGNEVQVIFWSGSDYIIYKTSRGVFVHFSDCKEREREQRRAFTEICPEICELRFLTHEMHSAEAPWYAFWKSRHRSRDNGSCDGPSLFDHNMGQAIMLLMEGESKQAKAIAHAALAMAVTRCTNDNTIRYVVTAMFAALALGLVVAFGPIVLGYFYPVVGQDVNRIYFIAALFGVIGGAFSVITRVGSFRMTPCQQSNMNYLMAWGRVIVGLISGLLLYLFVRHPFGGNTINPALLQDWGMAAVVGFLGGFAERLVPTVFRGAATALEQSSGTPVQEARKHQAPTG